MEYPWCSPFSVCTPRGANSQTRTLKDTDRGGGDGLEADWQLGEIESAKQTFVDSGLPPTLDPEWTSHRRGRAQSSG